MDELTIQDLKKAMRLLSTRFSDERFGPIATFLASTLAILQPLTKMQLPKEVEPVGYIRLLFSSEGRDHPPGPVFKILFSAVDHKDDR